MNPLHCTLHYLLLSGPTYSSNTDLFIRMHCFVELLCLFLYVYGIFFLQLIKEYNNCPILSSFPSLTSWQTQYLPCIVIFLAYEIYTYSYDTMWFLLMYVYIVYNDQIRVNYLSSQVFIILLHYFLLNIFVVFLLLQLLKILFLSLECEHPGNNSYVYFSGKCLILMNIILRSYFQGIQIFFFFY